MRRHARSLFVFAAAVFLAVLGLIWVKPAPQREALVESPGAPQAAAAASKPAAPAAVSPAPTAAAAVAVTPAQTLAFAERRTTLEQRAAAGDAAAAAELGGILANCWRYTPTTTQNIEDAVVNGLAGDVETPLVAGVPVPPELLLLMLQQSQQELARRCADVGNIKWKWKEMAQAPALLERAADAGQVQAMLDYAQHAFADYGSTEDMLRDADELKRRKEKARAFLRRALRHGEARAFMLQADAYAAGPLEKIDPAAAYAHMSAFFESPAAQDWPPRLRELYLQIVAQRLDAQQIQQAQERGRQLYQDFRNGVVAP